MSGMECLSSSPCYKDHLHHIHDELRLLDLKLLRESTLRQKSAVDNSGSTSALFISFEEVVSLLGRSANDTPDSAGDSEVLNISAMCADLAAEISTKLSASGQNSLKFPLLRLAGTFGLSETDLDILIMAFASETDRKYERVFGFLNDDMTRKLPCVSTALDLLCADGVERSVAARSFSPDAPLLYFNLVQLSDDRAECPFPGRRFMLDERIRGFIAGESGMHHSLSHIARLHYPPGAPASFSETGKRLKEKVVKLVSDEKAGRTVFWLHGKAGTGRKAFVQALCAESGLPLLTADIEDIFHGPDQKTVIWTLFREAALHSAVIFIEGGDRLTASDEKAEQLKRALIGTMEELSWTTFISADSEGMPTDRNGTLRWLPLEFRRPEFSERKKIWTDSLEGSSGITPREIDSLAGRFNFSEGQIRNTVRLARDVSNGNELTMDHIIGSCGEQSGKRISSFSKKVRPHFRMEDIVLQEERLGRLREMCDYIRHKHIVYYQWGFEKKLSLGRGLNALFSGPSGTGKTMAAGVIANELMLDMHKIDLSSVVSKYIGETEKNLNRVFSEISTGNSILFFDEADALFGKRSEVKDAHDRYANIEINYLLQKMEEHEGIVILATNLSRNIDDAFLRRINFNIEFPFPDEDHRELIWRKVFPGDAPLSPDIDFRFLAERMKVAGGNIRNIALTAAFYAAAGSSEIHMRHIILSAKREYQKMGKSFLKSDMEPYYGLAGVK